MEGQRQGGGAGRPGAQKELLSAGWRTAGERRGGGGGPVGWGRTLGGSDDQRGMWRALPLPTGPLGAAGVSGLILHPMRPPQAA